MMMYHRSSERACHVARIRRIQEPLESHRDRTARCAATTRSGVQEAGRSQSEQAWTKAETKAEVAYDNPEADVGLTGRYNGTSLRMQAVSLPLFDCTQGHHPLSQRVSQLPRTLDKRRTAIKFTIGRPGRHFKTRGVFAGASKVGARSHHPLRDSRGSLFPRPCRLAGLRPYLLPTSDQGFVSQPLSGELSQHHFEAFLHLMALGKDDWTNGHDSG